MADPVARERNMAENIQRERAFFAAALALFVTWIGALVVLAVVSGARPSEGKTRHMPPPAAAPAGSERSGDEPRSSATN